jgi:hypothetical protein
MDTVQSRSGQIFDGVVMKTGGGFLVFFRKTVPKLQPMNAMTILAQCIRSTFGVGNARAGNHQVDCTGRYALDAANAIFMNNFPFEEIGHGGQVNMRVGRNIETLAGLEIMRAHVIEKKPWPDTV